MATAGISLYHFYAIQPLTSVWTVIVSPLIGIVSILGYSKMILALFLPTAAAAMGPVISQLADWLIWIVRHIADRDISEILTGHIPAGLIILYYGTIFFTAFVYLGKPLFKKAICTAAISTIIIFPAVTKWQRTHREDLVLTCLSVGHGQAILAQLPGKNNILFDAGSTSIADVGGRVVSTFLDYSGTRTINALVISHGDIDHINGLAEVMENRAVAGVFANNDFLVPDDKRGTIKFLGDWMRQRRIKIIPAEEITSLGGAATIKILWPVKNTSTDNQQLNDNDKSLVCSIDYAGRKVLLCSDIGRFAQRELLRLIPDLKADVVVVPHHGSVSTLDNDFLGRLGAGILICSCGMSRYEKGQTIKPAGNGQFFYTPADGSVTVCINGSGSIKTTTFVPRRDSTLRESTSAAADAGRPLLHMNDYFNSPVFCLAAGI